jgi:hypothetical protein
VGFRREELSDSRSGEKSEPAVIRRAVRFPLQVKKRANSNQRSRMIPVAGEKMSQQ